MSRLAVDKASDPKIPAQFGSKSAKAANFEAASSALWQAAALGRAPFPDENKAMETQGKGLEPALSCGSLEEAPEETEAHGTCAVARGPKPSARGSPSARRRVRLAMAKEAKTKREAAAAEREAAVERAKRARGREAARAARRQREAQKKNRRADLEQDEKGALRDGLAAKGAGPKAHAAARRRGLSARAARGTRDLRKCDPEHARGRPGHGPAGQGQGARGGGPRARSLGSKAQARATLRLLESGTALLRLVAVGCALSGTIAVCAGGDGGSGKGRTSGLRRRAGSSKGRPGDAAAANPPRGKGGGGGGGGGKKPRIAGSMAPDDEGALRGRYLAICRTNTRHNWVCVRDGPASWGALLTRGVRQETWNNGEREEGLFEVDAAAADGTLKLKSAALWLEIAGEGTTDARRAAVRQWMRRCVLNLTADAGGVAVELVEEVLEVVRRCEDGLSEDL